MIIQSLQSHSSLGCVSGKVHRPQSRTGLRLQSKDDQRAYVRHHLLHFGHQKKVCSSVWASCSTQTVEVVLKTAMTCQCLCNMKHYWYLHKGPLSSSLDVSGIRRLVHAALGVVVLHHMCHSWIVALSSMLLIVILEILVTLADSTSAYLLGMSASRRELSSEAVLYAPDDPQG